MLHIKIFTFNPFQENTYILYNDQREAWIIDPGMMLPEEYDTFFGFIEQENLKPVQIINTHAHIDHILGIEAVKLKYNIPFGVHEAELPVIENAKQSAEMFGLPFDGALAPDFFLKEGAMTLGTDTLQLLLCPGHSPGSIVFYNEAEGYAIGGDVLFQRSIGRTDLKGGNHDDLINSIKKKLFVLPETTRIYPGHGPYTTIGVEMRENPFL